MLIAAALALPFALAVAEAAPAASGPTPFEACIALIDSDPNQAYEEGMARSALTGEVGGFRCAAMALIAEGRNEEGARRLEQLALSVSADLPGLRAELLSQAGNAWLLDRDPAHARSAFSRAVATVEGAQGAVSDSAIADLLIDRARAYALEGDWRHSEEDLSHALDKRPNDALALRLRSYARMEQSAFDLAIADAEAAVAIEPSNVDALLMLGHAREAKRTGAPVEPQ